MKASWGLLFVLGFGALGCNNCEKLTESLCNDLGAEDCASWREAGGPENVIPGGRGVNKACGMMLDNEASYQGTLQGARATAIAAQMQKAAAAKDDAKLAELKVKQAKVTAEIKASLAKLRQN